MTPLVAVVGPTAVGKSSLGIILACHLNGEIIGADSRQIYRYMDIGTAKPSPAERLKAIHHLIDIIYPDEVYNVAQYKDAAEGIIDSLVEKGKLALLVGGSGQYIWSIMENWRIPQIPPDLDFRAYMYKRADREGYQSLHAELEAVDAPSARRIMPENVRRVVRALEIFKQTGRSASELIVKGETRYKTLMIGLYSKREKLYQKIDKRVDDMVKNGLVDEVKSLIDRGYHSGLPSMSGIGYQQIAAYLENKVLLDEAIIKIKHATHRLARSQFSWFRLNDRRITWFDTDDVNPEKIIYTIKTFLGNR